MIKIITFLSQHDLSDVEKCIHDVQVSGGDVHSTSFTEDSQSLDMEVFLADEQDFRNQFIATESYQYSNYS